MNEPGDRLQALLLRELRGATSARIEDGADPEEVTADLTERLRCLRRTHLELPTRPSGG
jgi:hypothetical protein